MPWGLNWREERVRDRMERGAKEGGAKKGGALVLVGVIVLFGYLIYLDAVEDETLDDAYALAYVLIAVLVLFGLWYVVFKVGWRMTERFIKAVDGTEGFIKGTLGTMKGMQLEQKRDAIDALIRQRDALEKNDPAACSVAGIQCAQSLVVDAADDFHHCVQEVKRGARAAGYAPSHAVAR